MALIAPPRRTRAVRRNHMDLVEEHRILNGHYKRLFSAKARIDTSTPQSFVINRRRKTQTGGSSDIYGGSTFNSLPIRSVSADRLAIAAQNHILYENKVTPSRPSAGVRRGTSVDNVNASQHGRSMVSSRYDQSINVPPYMRQERSFSGQYERRFLNGDIIDRNFHMFNQPAKSHQPRSLLYNFQTSKLIQQSKHYQPPWWKSRSIALTSSIGRDKSPPPAGPISSTLSRPDGPIHNAPSRQLSWSQQQQQQPNSQRKVRVLHLPPDASLRMTREKILADTLLEEDAWPDYMSHDIGDERSMWPCLFLKEVTENIILAKTCSERILFFIFAQAIKQWRDRLSLQHMRQLLTKLMDDVSVPKDGLLSVYVDQTSVPNVSPNQQQPSKRDIAVSTSEQEQSYSEDYDYSSDDQHESVQSLEDEDVDDILNGDNLQSLYKRLEIDNRKRKDDRSKDQKRQKDDKSSKSKRNKSKSPVGKLTPIKSEQSPASSEISEDDHRSAAAADDDDDDDKSEEVIEEEPEDRKQKQQDYYSPSPPSIVPISEEAISDRKRPVEKPKSGRKLIRAPPAVPDSERSADASYRSDQETVMEVSDLEADDVRDRVMAILFSQNKSNGPHPPPKFGQSISTNSSNRQPLDQRKLSTVGSPFSSGSRRHSRELGLDIAHESPSKRSNKSTKLSSRLHSKESSLRSIVYDDSSDDYDYSTKIGVDKATRNNKPSTPIAPPVDDKSDHGTKHDPDNSPSVRVRQQRESFLKRLEAQHIPARTAASSGDLSPMVTPSLTSAGHTRPHTPVGSSLPSGQRSPTVDPSMPEMNRNNRQAKIEDSESNGGAKLENESKQSAQRSSEIVGSEVKKRTDSADGEKLIVSELNRTITIEPKIIGEISTSDANRSETVPVSSSELAVANTAGSPTTVEQLKEREMTSPEGTAVAMQSDPAKEESVKTASVDRSQPKPKPRRSLTGGQSINLVNRQSLPLPPSPTKMSIRQDETDQNPTSSNQVPSPMIGDQSARSKSPVEGPDSVNGDQSDLTDINDLLPDNDHSDLL